MSDFATLKITSPAGVPENITDTNATHSTSRGVYIGAADAYDFYFESTGTWILFNGCVAGTILPIQVKGARHASGDSAPDAGDIIFLR